MVMFPVTVVQRIRTDAKSEKNHPDLEAGMVNDIDTKQRETA